MKEKEGPKTTAEGMRLRLSAIRNLDWILEQRRAISGKAGAIQQSVVLYQYQVLSWDRCITVAKDVTIKGKWVKGIQELLFLIENFIEIIVDSHVKENRFL